MRGRLYIVDEIVDRKRWHHRQQSHPIRYTERTYTTYCVIRNATKTRDAKGGHGGSPHSGGHNAGGTLSWPGIVGPVGQCTGRSPKSIDEMGQNDDGRTPSSFLSPPARRVTFAQPQEMRQSQSRTSYQTFNNHGMRVRNNVGGLIQPFNPRSRKNFFYNKERPRQDNVKNVAGKTTHTRTIVPQ